MEAVVSEVLENVLSLLELEGSFDVEEKEEGVFVTIDTPTAGKLIGFQGETLAALQLIVNMVVSKKMYKDEEPEEKSKRVIIDVANWRKSKEDELMQKAKEWAQEVVETKKTMELLPMPSWQRRIVHMVVQDTPGITSESQGEGAERHLVLSPAVDEK